MDVVVQEVTPRPIMRVNCKSSGERFLLKLSRLSLDAATTQLETVSKLRPHYDRIPENFGCCIDAIGRVYEIWEWHEECESLSGDQLEEKTLALRDTFVRFIESSHRLPSLPPTITFPNRLGAVGAKLFNGGDIEALLDASSTSRLARNILARALDALKRPSFLVDLEGLPNAFIHTDIRAENIYGGFLIDFSNSRVDARLIELTRFVMLNFEHSFMARGLLDFAFGGFSDLVPALSEQEMKLLPEVASCDFACAYYWAKQQVARNEYRRSWAEEFISAGPARFEDFLSSL
jgi:hypothetical protein